MPLVTVPFEFAAGRLSPHVRRFLRTATRRVDRFHIRHRVPAFISTDFRMASAALAQLEASGIASGDKFVEWGSGLGVVTCLATMAGFDACGVEVQGSLVRAARRLASDFDLPTTFARGSFIPMGTGRGLVTGCEFAWLTTGGRCGHEALGIEIGEFDVIYAYPWPDEERLVERLFEGHARDGALLMTYDGATGMSLQRKTMGAGVAA